MSQNTNIIEWDDPVEIAEDNPNWNEEFLNHDFEQMRLERRNEWMRERNEADVWIRLRQINERVQEFRRSLMFMELLDRMRPYDPSRNQPVFGGNLGSFN